MLRNHDHAVVLLVDDDADNLVLLSYQISLLMPCGILSATEGHTALSLARTVQPDLILLDMMLPDLDGFQVVDHLKHDPLTHGIPVIAVTAMARLQDRERALQAGCDDYICKPYDLDVLEAAIYQQLNACSLPGKRLLSRLQTAS